MQGLCVQLNKTSILLGGGVTRPRPGGPLGDSYAAHGPAGRSREAGRSRTIAGGAAGRPHIVYASD